MRTPLSFPPIVQGESLTKYINFPSFVHPIFLSPSFLGSHQALTQISLTHNPQSLSHPTKPHSHKQTQPTNQPTTTTMVSTRRNPTSPLRIPTEPPIRCRPRPTPRAPKYSPWLADAVVRDLANDVLDIGEKATPVENISSHVERRIGGQIVYLTRSEDGVRRREVCSRFSVSPSLWICFGDLRRPTGGMKANRAR
jgi:hypothetical protein